MRRFSKIISPFLRKIISVGCILMLSFQTLFLFQVQVLSTAQGVVTVVSQDFEMEGNAENKCDLPTGNRTRPLIAEEEEENAKHLNDQLIACLSISQVTLLGTGHGPSRPLTGYYFKDIQPPDFS